MLKRWHPIYNRFVYFNMIYISNIKGDFMSMRTTLTIFRSFINILLIAFLLVGCGDDSDSDSGGGGSQYSLALGDWTGDDLSFTVTSGSYYVNDLSVTYRGSADGTICNYDYENESTIGTKIHVTNNTFSYESSGLTISGEFTSATSVEVDVSWETYNSHCDATESGSTMLTANSESGGGGSGLCVEISYDYFVPMVFIKDVNTGSTVESLAIQFVEGCLFDTESNLVGCWTNLEQGTDDKITNIDISIDDSDFDDEDYNYPSDACN